LDKKIQRTWLLSVSKDLLQITDYFNTNLILDYIPKSVICP